MKDLNYPKKSKDVPVTKAMLDEAIGGLKVVIDSHYSEFQGFRSEVRREFKSFRSEVEGEFVSFRSEVANEFAAVRKEVKGEFAAVRKEMADEFAAVRSEMASEFTAVRTEMSQGFTEVKSEIHRLALLVEEQNARNIFVLDALTQLSDRQERLEKDYSKRFGS